MTTRTVMKTRVSTMGSDDDACTERGVEEENENISAVGRVITEPKDQRRCEGAVGDLCAAGAPDLTANSPMVTSSVAQNPQYFPPELHSKVKGTTESIPPRDLERAQEGGWLSPV